MSRQATLLEFLEGMTSFFDRKFKQFDEDLREEIKISGKPGLETGCGFLSIERTIFDSNNVEISKKPTLVIGEADLDCLEHTILNHNRYSSRITSNDLYKYSYTEWLFKKCKDFHDRVFLGHQGLKY